MAEQYDSTSTMNNGGVRQPRPEAAAQDPEAAALQQQTRADSDLNRREAARVQASAPADVRDKTVQQITEEAERRARGEIA
jgi:hypothetical protein